MSKRSFRLALRLVVGSLALVILLMGAGAYWVYRYLDTPHAGRGAKIELQIVRGQTFTASREMPSIDQLLAAKGLVAHPRWFRYFAMYKGAAREIKAGTYVLADNLSPRALLAELRKGAKEPTVRVTLPEGKHMLEYFALLEVAGVAKAAELEAAARDQALLTKLGIRGETVDGYLFPDSYELRKAAKPADVITQLVAHHRKVWQELLKTNQASYDRLAAQLKWTPHEFVVLASIVEKEAVAAAEQATIAGVFINRLTVPTFTTRRLETDPTIRYGCMVPTRKSEACRKWDKTDRLHRAQLDDVDNPYNTYRHAGLPPGPISNPGRGALAAALSPASHSYLFFVAKDERSHTFSTTLEEHRRAVAAYVQRTQ